MRQQCFRARPVASGVGPTPFYMYIHTYLPPGIHDTARSCIVKASSTLLSWWIIEDRTYDGQEKKIDANEGVSYYII